MADAASLDIRALVEKYGLQDGTIRAILRRNNVGVKKPNPARLLIPKEKLEAILANGWLPISELGKLCGCSYAKVKKSLVAHGILRGRKPTTRNRIHQATRSFQVLGYIMANPSLELDNIAKEFNCTREYVSQIEAMARKEGIIK